MPSVEAATYIGRSVRIVPAGAVVVDLRERLPVAVLTIGLSLVPVSDPRSVVLAVILP
jgi:hypothetical protein